MIDNCSLSLVLHKKLWFYAMLNFYIALQILRRFVTIVIKKTTKKFHMTGLGVMNVTGLGTRRDRSFVPTPEFTNMVRLHPNFYNIRGGRRNKNNITI